MRAARGASRRPRAGRRGRWARTTADSSRSRPSTRAVDVALLDFARIQGEHELDADVFTGPYRVRGTMLVPDDDPAVLARPWQVGGARPRGGVPRPRRDARHVAPTFSALLFMTRCRGDRPGPALSIRTAVHIAALGCTLGRHLHPQPSRGEPMPQAHHRPRPWRVGRRVELERRRDRAPEPGLHRSRPAEPAARGRRSTRRTSPRSSPSAPAGRSCSSATPTAASSSPTPRPAPTT